MSLAFSDRKNWTGRVGGPQIECNRLEPLLFPRFRAISPNRLTITDAKCPVFEH